MIVLPSVDIEAGRAVKRERGSKGTGMKDLGDPRAVARRWTDAGAQGLHLVDLDGAEGAVGGKDGPDRSGNRALVLEILRTSKVPVQVGGGVREVSDLKELLDAGAWRVLLSTRAWQDPAWLREVAARFGRRVGLSFDVSGDTLRLRGWTQPGPKVEVALQEACEVGVGFLLYTDIDREGRGAGIERKALEPVRRQFRGDLYAAGGISTLEDLRALASAGVDGVVVGRALYEGLLPLDVLKGGAP